MPATTKHIEAWRRLAGVDSRDLSTELATLLQQSQDQFEPSLREYLALDFSNKQSQALARQVLHFMCSSFITPEDATVVDLIATLADAREVCEKLNFERTRVPSLLISRIEADAGRTPKLSENALMAVAFYPDTFKPEQIRDVGLEVARRINLGLATNSALSSAFSRAGVHFREDDREVAAPALERIFRASSEPIARLQALELSVGRKWYPDLTEGRRPAKAELTIAEIVEICVDPNPENPQKSRRLLELACMRATPDKYIEFTARLELAFIRIHDGIGTRCKEVLDFFIANAEKFDGIAMRIFTEGLLFSDKVKHVADWHSIESKEFPQLSAAKKKEIGQIALAALINRSTFPEITETRPENPQNWDFLAAAEYHDLESRVLIAISLAKNCYSEIGSEVLAALKKSSGLIAMRLAEVVKGHAELLQIVGDPLSNSSARETAALRIGRSARSAKNLLGKFRDNPGMDTYLFAALDIYLPHDHGGGRIDGIDFKLLLKDFTVICEEIAKDNPTTKPGCLRLFVDRCHQLRYVTPLQRLYEAGDNLVVEMVAEELQKCENEYIKSLQDRESYSSCSELFLKIMNLRHVAGKVTSPADDAKRIAAFAIVGPAEKPYIKKEILKGLAELASRSHPQWVVEYMSKMAEEIGKNDTAVLKHSDFEAPWRECGRYNNWQDFLSRIDEARSRRLWADSDETSRVVGAALRSNYPDGITLTKFLDVMDFEGIGDDFMVNLDHKLLSLAQLRSLATGQKNNDEYIITSEMVTDKGIPRPFEIFLEKGM